MVPAELRKVFLSFQQAIAKAATLKMVHCLAKHSSDTVKHEMEMKRRGSKRTVEDANLARQDADRSDDIYALQEKEKVFERMFGGSLPSPVASMKFPTPMRNSSRGCPSRTKSSMFMHVCWRTEMSQMLVLQVGRQPGSRRIRHQR
jgi:hypothetical protein